MLYFLLVIPAMNEAEYIEGIVLKADKEVGKYFKRYKIAVVDASSTDNTVNIVERLAKKNGRIDLIKGRKRGAKGGDIMYAFSRYDSALYGFIDSDIASAVGSFGDLIGNKRCDVIIGSRYVDSKAPERPKLRLYISLFYNRLLSVLFGDGVTDNQCGFKIFNKRAVKLIERYSLERHWPWDTEALLICNSGGLRICEKKINWIEVRNRNNDANIKRAISDVYLFIVPMFRMFYRFRIARVVKK